MINLLSFKNLLSSDGIHLNTEGHKWIYNQISEWEALINWANLK
jgi:lysophospholipase L1-like esterase